MTQTVWVVTVSTWGDDNDHTTVIGVFDDETSRRMVFENNEKRTSSYSPEWDREEFVFNERAR